MGPRVSGKTILGAEVVDGTSHGPGAHVRIVEDGTWRHLELRGKDRTGGVRWDTIMSVNLADSPAHQFPSNVCPPAFGQALFYTMALLDDVAAKREALARTMNYSPADDAPRGHGGL